LIVKYPDSGGGSTKLITTKHRERWTYWRPS